MESGVPAFPPGRAHFRSDAAARASVGFFFVHASSSTPAAWSTCGATISGCFAAAMARTVSADAFNAF